MENIFIIKNEIKIFVEKLENIPVSFNGKAEFMVENILAATLGAYTAGISIPMISTSLKRFVLNSETTPGRLNRFDFNGFSIMIDYAHNFHGIRALGSFLKQEQPGYKVGIVTTAGDRRDIDIINVGKAAAEIFEKIIIRVDEDTRGRNASEIVELLTQGIFEVDPDKLIEVVPNELDAIKYALQTAIPGSLIVHLSDDVKRCIAFVKECQEKGIFYETTQQGQTNFHLETYFD